MLGEGSSDARRTVPAETLLEKGERNAVERLPWDTMSQRPQEQQTGMLRSKGCTHKDFNSPPTHTPHIDTHIHTKTVPTPPPTPQPPLPAPNQCRRLFLLAAFHLQKKLTPGLSLRLSHFLSLSPLESCRENSDDWTCLKSSLEKHDHLPPCKSILSPPLRSPSWYLTPLLRIIISIVLIH